MRRFVLLMALVLGGCECANPPNVTTLFTQTDGNGRGLYRYDDTDAGVQCWIFADGISCLRNGR